MDYRKYIKFNLEEKLTSKKIHKNTRQIPVLQIYKYNRDTKNSNHEK